MKKLFSIIVVAALATSFASCGGGVDKAAAEKAAADSTRIADSTANAAAAEAVAVPDTTAAPASTEAAAPAGH